MPSPTKTAPRRRAPGSLLAAVALALIAPAAAVVLIAGMAMSRYLQPDPTPTLVASLVPAVAVASAAPAEAAALATLAPTAAGPASDDVPSLTAPPQPTQPPSATAPPTLAGETPTASPPTATAAPVVSSAASATPTIAASLEPSASPTATPSASPTPTNTAGGPTLTPSLTPPATPQPGWAFTALGFVPDTSSNLLYVYGELVNNTGAAQQILNISGSFYDGQGRLLAGPLDTLDRLPTDVLPAGSRLPFELLVIGPTSVANYALSVEARSSSLAVRDGFTFSDSSVVSQRGQTCLASTLARPEPAVADYLTIAVAWVDEAGRVVALSDPYEPTLEELAGPHSFTVCTDLRGVSASGYLLRAWGN